MENIFQVRDQVIHLPSGNRCIIVATKTEPFVPNSDPFNRKERYPKNDFLLLIFKESDNNSEHWAGELDVKSEEIEMYLTQ